jgi:hypothetical protein
MITPRDSPPQFAVPVNSDTGFPLTENQLHHLGALKEAAGMLYAAMHAAEGTSMPGEHADHSWSGRRMAIAATHIETGLMFARKAAVER